MRSLNVFFFLCRVQRPLESGSSNAMVLGLLRLAYFCYQVSIQPIKGSMVKELQLLI